MRFFVEVTPIGQSETQRYCVEAASWQVALQNTRTLRNDAGPISGFSIELTDEGCRAVDPMARLRFMVKQAPDSAPLTGDRPSDAPTKIQESPLFKEQVAAALAASAAASGAPAPSAAATHAVLAAAPTPSAGERPSEKMAASKKMPARTIAYGSSGAIVTREPSDRLKELANIAVKEEPAKAPAAAISKPAPALSNDAEPRVLFHRAQDPTAASPLTYREDVLAVAPGTTEEDAAKILRKHLASVQNAIIGAPPGKYVNLAIFDQVFEGKPPVLPLVILSWKDWLVEPLQSFPRRGKAPAGPTQASSHMAPAAAQAIAAASPAFPPRPSAASIPIPLATKVSERPPEQPPANVAASAPPPALAALGEALAKANSAPPPAMQHPSGPPPGIAALAGAFPPSQHQPVNQPASHPPPPRPVSQRPPQQQHPSVPPVPFIPIAELPVFEAPAPQVAAPVVMTETPPPVAMETPPPKGSTESARLRLSRPPSSPNLGRVRGDELIAILFEEMHDVHFLNDAIEGGAFCLGLALEKLPSRAGIVHLYDINKREFVIVTANGKGTEHLLARRHGESDPLLAAAMRKRNSVVMNNADSNDEAFIERYELIGGAKSLIISPVMKGGRFLGAIELINPLDGAPFTEDEGNALAYMSEQYAEFVSVRGVLIDPERIAAAARPR